VIHSNVISNVRLLVAGCNKVVRLEDQSLIKQLEAVPDSEDTVLDAAVGELVTKIWNDPGAQASWARRSEFQVQDALSWYMREIPRLAAKDYIPSVDDILRARVRTSGIVEESYVIDGIDFVMYDVGGQRNERKKWVHCFDAVTAVIFVAAISEYDQFLYEDDQMYRMDESVILFDEVCNLKYFTSTSMILFLNKNDLFREKLRTIPLRIAEGPHKRYENFAGPYVSPSSSPEEFEKGYLAAREYILQLFLRRNQRPQREVYHHVTCATDTSNIKVVFSACKDIILKNNLRGSGFMD